MPPSHVQPHFLPLSRVGIQTLSKDAEHRRRKLPAARLGTGTKSSSQGQKDTGPLGVRPHGEGAMVVTGQGTGRRAVGSDRLTLSSSLEEQAGWPEAVGEGSS